MSQSNIERWDKVKEKVKLMQDGIAQVIVGQDKIVLEIMISLLCKGHCLIVGVPGLAKTLLVSTLGQLLGLSFRRIQFTPDMMPMDIIGSEILQGDESGIKRRFEFSPGPIFANLILADEINRTPPKTQAALLEAMQEKQVTVSGKTMKLHEPFIVYATQNPIEHEGTYPLPEAQLDRFFFNLLIDYPSIDEERLIVQKTTGRHSVELKSILGPEDVMELQDAALDVPVPDNVQDYILKIANFTRPVSNLSDDYIKQYVAWGAGPRASQNLTRAAKALALLKSNPSASVEEVREIARPVLRHRVIPNYNATGEGISVEMIIDHVLDTVQ